MLYAFVKLVAVLLARLCFRTEAHGTENVPQTGPALVVSNHSSVLDPPLMGATVPRPLHFMAKEELFRIPLFGWLIRRVNALPIKRGTADPSALRMSMRVLEEGGALLVFPEATRTPEGVIGEGRPGAGMLAVLSGVPVVPAYIEGSGRAWPKGRRFPRPTKVRVRFGRPMQFKRDESRGRKEQYAAASRAMMAAIANLKDEAK